MLSDEQIEHCGRQYVAQLRALRDAVEKRILPAFANVSNEGDAIMEGVFQQRALEGGGHAPDYDSFQDSEVAEAARFEHFDLMTRIEQSLINAMVVTTSQLFEQQLTSLVRRVYPPLEKKAPKELADKPRDSFKSIVKERSNVDLDGLPEWAKAEELRFVANAIKHADGGSAAEYVRLHRPDLLVPPSLRREGKLDTSHRSDSLEFPALGEDIYVTPAQLAEYLVALCSFWDAFPAKFRECRRPLTF